MKARRILAAHLMLLVATALRAADITVTTDASSGPGSLAEAVASAMSNGEADTIDFAPSLNGATIVVSSALSGGSDGFFTTIDATALPNAVTLLSAGANRLVLNTGMLKLRGLKLTGATLTGGSGGGAVYSNNTLELDRCTVSGNSADFGGGALFNDGMATVTRCTFSGNSSAGVGGAIYNNAGMVTIEQSTISGNTAGTNDSIFNDATLTLRHCTVVGDTDPGGSATISNAAGRTLTIENSVFSGGDAFTPTITNTGVLTRVGANLMEGGISTSGGGTESGPMLIHGQTKLAALGNYGGPTQTQPPLPGSPAIDAAVGSVETIDQRGVTRPLDGNGDSLGVADLGAVEYGSGNANLASLNVSTGTLVPAFSDSVAHYVADVAVGTASVTIIPTVQDDEATLTVNGAPVASGAASDAIPLVVGANTISVVVSSQIGTTKTYTIIVNRPTRVVTNTNNSGAGSLRQLLSEASASGVTEFITFAPGLSGGTIVLASTLGYVSSNPVTIDASALPGGITLDRNHGNSAVFFNNGNVTMRALTLTRSAAANAGGGVLNYADLTMERCTISGNAAPAGAGFFNTSTMILRQCTISGNGTTGTSGQGGAIYNNGSATLIHCTVFGNSAPLYGGIFNFTGKTMVIENTIVAGNGSSDLTNAGTLTLNRANIVQTAIAGGGLITGSGTVSNVDPQLAALGNNGGPTRTHFPQAGSPAIDAAVGSTETIDQRGIARPIDGDVNGSLIADIGAVEFASGNTDLVELTLSQGDLDPTFASTTTSYAASVLSVTPSITVTPTAGHPAATISVNGTPVASGGESDSIPLNVGENTITLVVTAQNGVTTKTYTVVVTRPSNDASLADLVLSAGTLSPVFDPGTASYTVSVPFETSSITVTPTAAESHATITVNGDAVASGTASASIALEVGMNTITIVGTAQDGFTMETYTVAITRGGNSNLAALSLSEGVLSPVFASGTTSYTARVANGTNFITVTPDVAEGNATVTVNGQAVDSGTESSAIALSLGTNTITVEVTAPVGPTVKTYTVTVLRPYLVTVTAASGPGSLRQAILDAEANPGPDAIVFDSSLGGQTINLTGGPMSVNSTAGLTIDGSALPGGATISGDLNGSVFGVSGTAVFISLTITNGGSPGGSTGAIFNNGTLTLIDCTLRQNSTPNGFGGALFNFNGGNLSLDRCTLTQNHATSGGAIYIGNNCTTTIRNTTFTGNTAGNEAGAISIPGDNVTTLINHCTVVGNSAPTGGGIVIGFAGASATLDNSIVAGNTGTFPDFYNLGTLTLSGANIVQAGISNANVVTGSGTVATVDPQLGPLADNGGPTQTMIPLPSSPAIDAAPTSELAIDQRGVPRPLDGDLNSFAVADIGAVEFGSSNVDLVSLVPSVGAISPMFGSETTNYALDGLLAATQISVTPTAAHGGASITINGAPVGSGDASAAIPLNPGTNTITTVVTSQDGLAEKTYVLTINRTAPEFVIEQPAGTTLADESTIDFGAVKLGASGTPVTFTIKNTGPDPLTLASIETTGGSQGDFAVDDDETLSTVPATSGSTSFTVTFTPGALGVRNATLRILSDDPDNSPFEIHLNGTGNAAPVLTLPDSPVMAEATSNAGATVTFSVSAIDEEDGTLTPEVAPASGSTFAIGDTTVNVSATDGDDATTTGSFIVRVRDTTPPTIAAPVNGFTPLVVYSGMMPDFRDQAVTADVVGVTSVSQDPSPDAATMASDVEVTLTAQDAAGNTADLSFTLVIRPANAVNTAAFASGEAAPGAGTNGLPADAVLTSFNAPATDDAGDLAFIAKWSSNNGKTKGTGLFLNNQCLAVIGGDASAVGGAGAKWRSFRDPIVDEGHLVCLATLSGVPSASSAVIVGNLSGSELELIARSGELATGTGDAKFRSFRAVAVRRQSVAFFAQLATGSGTPRVTTASDLGLWFYEPGNPLFIMREGDMVEGRKIKTLAPFLRGNGSPGSGRGTLEISTLSGGPVVSSRVVFTDNTQGVISQDIDVGPPSLALSLTGDVARGLSDGTTFASYNVPAFNQDETTCFLGRLTRGGTVTKSNANGIFTGPDINGAFATVIRIGDDAVNGAKFTALKDPVLSSDGVIAFPATIRGGSVKAVGGPTLWSQSAAGALTLLAQGGTEAGDLAGSQWRLFSSLAIAGGGRGPIFAATLVPGKGGVTATKARGVWACDFTGKPRLLFRRGDPMDVGGTTRTLSDFLLLNSTTGSTGVTRSHNDAGQVVWRASFSDKTQAIMVSEVP